ncbi:glycosyltransferase family 2 protein [Bordetella bronchiseptica]|uniref:glycosyltransferase family 2 protein n=1 Tax=Bordetella bronchiseptica TaxID=518 RepID=UPI00070B0A6C|nr:glycosyltransferase family 2 protein [Bordetella bronchiseptica]
MKPAIPRPVLTLRPFVEHNIQLSIVIPFLNESEVLPICHARLSRVLEALDEPYEIVFVDDGSTDGSVEYLIELMRRDRRVRVIKLSRNFGKEAAMSAGLSEARGSAVILLDADLQDPPELIPEMMAAWKAGVDVVSMRRRSRSGESWGKRTSAYLFYRLLSRLSRSPIPADTGDFRLMSRRAVEALLAMPERCRYMKGLYAWIGMPTTVIDYDREPRAAGKTKWSYCALLGLAIEGITSFSTAPLRWVTIGGALVAVGGGIFGLSIVVKALLFGNDADGYPSLMAMITLLSGMQLVTIGLLGEYVGKAYMESKQRPMYVVHEILSGEEETSTQPAVEVAANASVG